MTSAHYNAPMHAGSPATHPRVRRVAITALMLAALSIAGCVERTISITSEPAGALVYLNDEEVGRTPLKVGFKFYGVYDVRLEAPGHAPLWTKQNAEAPWWEAPGPDLFAEMVPDGKSELHWHFKLDPASVEDSDAVIDRAHQLRATLRDTPATTQPK